MVACGYKRTSVSIIQFNKAKWNNAINSFKTFNK